MQKFANTARLDRGIALIVVEKSFTPLLMHLGCYIGISFLQS